MDRLCCSTSTHLPKDRPRGNRRRHQGPQIPFSGNQFYFLSSLKSNNQGVKEAVSHPFATGGVAFGLGFVLLKGPRRFLYYNTSRLLMNEEALYSQANAKVKELQQSINLLNAESERLQKRASSAAENLIHGKTKPRQACKQIQGVIQSAYKIERQAAGLKDILGEWPSREASRFQSKVSSLASEAKRERNTLSKEDTKISNYGISI